MANTFDKIQTVTVGSGGSANIEFTSIPQTYTDLKVVLSSRTATGGAADNIIVFNGDTSSSYSQRQIQGNGSSASSSSGTNTGFTQSTTTNGSTDTASVFASSEIYIPNYASANNKSFSVETVTENNATTAYQTLRAGLYSSSSAITSLRLTNSSSANFAQHSSATLYGIKNT